MIENINNDYKQIIKDSTQYITSSVIAQGVSFLPAVFLPALLGPAQFGVWNFMNVIIGYGANAHFGILHGFNKVVPELRAVGKINELNDLIDSVFWVNLFLGILVGFFLLVYSILFQSSYALPSKVAAVVVVLQMIFQFYFSLLRAESRFKLVSTGVAGLSIASSIFVLLLANFFNDKLFGALCGLVVAYIIIVAYWFNKGEYNIKARIKLSLVKYIFGIGFHLIILGILSMVLLSVDRWIIAWKLQDTALGYYALGIMATNMLGMIPISIANVLYPRMLERFATTQDRTAVGNLYLIPVRAIASLMIFFISATIVYLPVLINLLLPKYSPAIPLINILVPGAFFLSIAPITGNFVIAVNQHKALICTGVVSIIAGIIVDIVLLQIGYGISGVAYGTIMCYSIYGLGYVCIALFLIESNWRCNIKFLAQLFALFVVMRIALSLTEIFISGHGSWIYQIVSSTQRLFVVFLIIAPFVWFLNKGSNIFSTVLKNY